MTDLLKQIKLNIAGATLRHKSKFATLASFENNEELSQDFIDTWVVPYYMNIGLIDDNWTEQLLGVRDQITKEIVTKLLGDFDWRTRQTGAFFASIKNYTDLTDIIGIHLLKSEVCYAGQVYAYTFASFNTDTSIKYLNEYLTYYLSEPDLWFDQQYAMEALTYLDTVNKTDLASKHMDKWSSFLKNKSNWNKRISTDKLEAQLELIETIKNF